MFLIFELSRKGVRQISNVNSLARPFWSLICLQDCTGICLDRHVIIPVESAGNSLFFSVEQVFSFAVPLFPDQMLQRLYAGFG